MASDKREKPKRPPATTVEGREKQLVSMATDLAEKQLANGTASSQVITHYLKLATVREKLEREKIAQETKLLTARVDDIHNAREGDAMYSKALEAMREYTGQQPLEANDE